MRSMRIVLFAAFVPQLSKVAEYCTEDADVEIWVQNHAKAKLSVEQAEASRALWRKDHVHPDIKDMVVVSCKCRVTMFGPPHTYL